MKSSKRENVNFCYFAKLNARENKHFYHIIDGASVDFSIMYFRYMTSYVIMQMSSLSPASQRNGITSPGINNVKTDDFDRKTTTLRYGA